MTKSQNITEAALLAKEAKLHYSTDSKKGITRNIAGKSISYYDPGNNKITDQETIDRITALGIPPAWKEVWVNPDALGHIQATGKDEKGRKQYRYHPDWIALSQEHKFEHMLMFSDQLSAIRKRLTSDMQKQGLPMTKVLATVVWLLDNTYIRIGNQSYARDNKHYGLTTLRNKHVDITGSTVHFHFIGKSGKEHEVDIAHPRVARTIRKLEELPGYDLFQYVDEGKRHTVTSELVNDYLQDITGEAISAKYFRTWGGTVLAAVTLNNLGAFTTKKEAKKNITQAVKEVAHHLRNTPTISRNYYIHPLVPDSYQKEQLIPHFAEAMKQSAESELTKEETAVALLLQKSV